MGTGEISPWYGQRNLSVRWTREKEGIRKAVLVRQSRALQHCNSGIRLFSAQTREVIERHREVVCPVYAAKEEGSSQKKVPLKEGT